MDNGWISIHRKLTKWGWYQKSEMVHIFLHLLLMANHEDGKWQGHIIKRGQFITGRLSLSKDTGISQQTIRTCLDRLKSTNEITIKSTNKFSIITILKYEDYQSEQGRLTIKSTTKLTNNQPTTNQQLTTNNKDNNEKKEILQTEVCEEFSSKEYIENMINSKQRHIHIIGLFFSYKELKFDNLAQVQAQIPQHLKYARLLTAYSDEQIQETFKVVDKESDYDKKYQWNLNTIIKKIQII